MANKQTIFNKLSKRLNNLFIGKPQTPKDGVLFRTNNKEEYEEMLLQKKQNKHYLSSWVKANYNTNLETLTNINYVKLMYRDVELMDNFPELSCGLDIIMEEVCHENRDGNIINIYSKNQRIKQILEDLFYNRLAIKTLLPMIVRATCKYGNEFWLLNPSDTDGIVGWKQLPVEEVERYEGKSIYNNYQINDLNGINKIDDGETHFVWRSSMTGGIDVLKNFQMAHFRLIFDNKALPMGVSYMNSARRHFRMLMMAEDMMLVYRLERSMERRVFKINIGGIDPNDAQAYINDIANNFKRTPLVDPQTGQLDLYKNILNPSEDYFVPVVDPSEPSPIETLPGASNLTAIEDIQYIQRKVLACMKIPEHYLSFAESPSDGRNLSSVDIRFAKSIRRIQQAIIAELNKIAIIHLSLLGFEDDLTNFSITMNNPSSTMELNELELWKSKITLIKDATNDSGHGIPPMSMNTALAKFMGYSQSDIRKHYNELRLEKALTLELEKTNEVYGRTGVFDDADNIYGRPGAQYLPKADDGTDQESNSGIGGMASESFSDTSMFSDEGSSENVGLDDIEVEEPSTEIETETSDIQVDSIQKKGFLLTEELNQITKEIKEYLK